MKLTFDDVEKYHFERRFDIRIGDLNYGNHMANETVASYVNDMRVGLIKHLGYNSELEIEGISLIMVNSRTEFRGEGYHGDQILGRVAAINMQRSSFDLVCHFQNETQKRELAIVQTGMLFFDYDKRKVMSIPQAFRDRLENI